MAFRRSLVAAASLALLGAFVLTSAPTSTADSSVEAAVLAKIRASRSGGLVVHSGLLSAARAHSMYMSRHGMNHDNADSRVRNASPDPFETNGAPDDGFGVASWCENVTYSTGHPASEVPGRIYSQWAGSGAHGRCMGDSSRNVGAVGVYYDGTTWWATFIAQVDKTPPGGSSGGTAPQKTSAPKAPPAVSADEPAASSAPAQQPASQPVGSNANPDTGSDAQTTGTQAADPDVADYATVPLVAADEGEITVAEPQPLRTDTNIAGDDEPLTPRRATEPIAYGWQELLAVAGVLAIATFILWRRVRRLEAPLYVPPEFTAEAERHDAVVRPDGELVGAGASHT